MMDEYKHYQMLLTENQVDQVNYVCDGMLERFEAWIEDAKQYGERPFSDRPEVPYMEIVCDTLTQIQRAIEIPVYEGKTPLVVIDADQKVHLLNVCADYHSFLVDFLSDRIDDGAPKTEVVDDLYTLYLIGNIEGRLLYGGLTDGDMKILTDWDEFLEGLKEEEFPEEKEVVLDLDKWYKCPDCGESCQGNELIYPVDSGELYVCPKCGCIQERAEVERQLREEE